MNRKLLIFERILALGSAIILLQTLYFKFTGKEISVAIFTELEVEPYGRIFIGILELIAAVLLIIPRTAANGALIGMAVMLGAMLSHSFILGIEYRGDGGKLFYMSVGVFIACFTVLFIRRDDLLYINWSKKRKRIY